MSQLHNNHVIDYGYDLTGGGSGGGGVIYHPHGGPAGPVTSHNPSSAVNVIGGGPLPGTSSHHSSHSNHQHSSHQHHSHSHHQPHQTGHSSHLSSPQPPHRSASAGGGLVGGPPLVHSTYKGLPIGPYRGIGGGSAVNVVVANYSSNSNNHMATSTTTATPSSTSTVVPVVSGGLNSILKGNNTNGGGGGVLVVGPGPLAAPNGNQLVSAQQQSSSQNTSQNNGNTSSVFMSGFSQFDGFVASVVDQNTLEGDEEDKNYVSGGDSDEEGDRSFLLAYDNSPNGVGNAKSAAIDIRPTKPWKRLNGTNRSRNFGKVAINMDTNLSSSTDELLKLAGGGPLQKLIVKLPSYEDSPPSTPDNLAHLEAALQQATITPQSAIGTIHPSLIQPPSIGTLPQPPIGPLPQPPISTIIDNQAPIISQPQCRYFANGFCSQGERCNFAHIEMSVGFNTPTVIHRTRFRNGRPPIPASQYANLKLEDCIGEIAPMCLDQHGCRYLQRQLDSGDAKIIQIIFDEVILNIVSLMSDPFGNYLCQKLIENCSEAQRIEIVKGVASDIVQISKNMHGTRAVQKLIEHLSSKEENKLVRKALKGSVVALIQDLNGNHVIQKCLHKMEPNDNQFIYDAVAQHCVQVSTHRHGCCVMQRCVDHASTQQKLQLVHEIKEAAMSLVLDAFGNYVVQYALDLDIPNLATELIMKFQGRLLYLARLKFSSNVVEKCLKVGNSLCVTRVLRELMDEDPNPDVPNPVPSPHPEKIQQNLVELLQDSYGNYVIQTCLSEGAVKAPLEYTRMANLLNPYIHQLRNAPYVKRILNLLNLPTKLPDPEPQTDSLSIQNSSANDFLSARQRENNRSRQSNLFTAQRFPRQ